MNNTLPACQATAKPLAQPRAWAGLDVAKETFDAALWLPLESGAARGQRPLPVRGFPRTPDGIGQFLAWADPLLAEAADPSEPVPILRVVMEATGKYSLELAVWLIAQRPSLAPAIVNPEMAAHFAKSLSLRNKTDKLEARALARYGAERNPAPYEPPSPAQAELRDLARYRQTIVELRDAEKNRAQEGSASALVRRQQQTLIRHYQRDIDQIEKKMKKVLEKLPDLKRDVETLDGIYGVGFITAATVAAELGDLRRFEQGRTLTAFAGLSPRNGDSGTSVHKRARMCKKGSAQVRRALFMPAMTTIRGDNDLADLYRRLVAQGLKKMAALGAVMRKLLLVMRAVLISGKPYQRHYRTCGKVG